MSLEAIKDSLARFIKSSDRLKFQEFLLDSVVVCGEAMSRRNFMNRCFSSLQDSTIVTALKDTSNLMIDFRGVLRSDFPHFARRRALRSTHGYWVHQIELITSINGKSQQILSINLVPTYPISRIYEINFHNKTRCCR